MGKLRVRLREACKADTGYTKLSATPLFSILRLLLEHLPLKHGRESDLVLVTGKYFILCSGLYYTDTFSSLTFASQAPMLPPRPKLFRTWIPT